MPMMDRYLTEVGFKILEQQYGLYLNIARWHQIHVMLLACDSVWSQSPKLCLSFTVMVITQLQRELPILWSPSGCPI